MTFGSSACRVTWAPAKPYQDFAGRLTQHFGSLGKIAAPACPANVLEAEQRRVRPRFKLMRCQGADMVKRA